ncbi:hypothetical protein FHU13_004248 [Methylobacterium sp. R2-1]|nr:hypothetical protein [Methylobacterium sp. R2-1]
MRGATGPDGLAAALMGPCGRTGASPVLKTAPVLHHSRKTDP